MSDFIDKIAEAQWKTFVAAQDMPWEALDEKNKEHARRGVRAGLVWMRDNLAEEMMAIQYGRYAAVSMNLPSDFGRELTRNFWQAMIDEALK